MYDSLINRANQLSDTLIGLRRDLHTFPELSWKEQRTASQIRKILEENGLVVSDLIAGTGFYTDIAGLSDGPTIAYRADMDALPIQDQKKVPYASRVDGVAHMCGHDYHSSVAVGVALLLHGNRQHLNGTVRVFWQPAEESTPSGAPRMIEDGVLNGISAVFGIHCDPFLDSGTVSIRDGALTGSYDAFEISVRSDASIHSARPHLGKDTMWIASQLISHLYQLSGRISDARKPSVISVCTIQGGTAANIIPDRVTFSGTVRTSDPDTRSSLLGHMRSTCKVFGELHGADIVLELQRGAPPVINDAMLFKFAEASLQSVLDEKSIQYAELSMGAEDFAYYTEQVPGFFMRIGTRCDQNTSHALHTALFDLDDSTIPFAVALQSHLLISYLSDQKAAD